MARWIGVEWANAENDTYSTTLHINARERNGLVMDIATVLSTVKVKMTSFNARDTGDGHSVASITLEVHNSGELSTVISRLSVISGVTEVQRSDR